MITLFLLLVGLIVLGIVVFVGGALLAVCPFVVVFIMLDVLMFKLIFKKKK